MAAPNSPPSNRPQHIDTSRAAAPPIVRTASRSSDTPSSTGNPSSPRVSRPEAFSSLFPQFHNRMPESMSPMGYELFGEGEQARAPSEEIHEDDDADVTMAQRAAMALGADSDAAEMTPEVSLELRLRWLEALVLGSGGRRVPPGRHSKQLTHPLVREADEVQERLAAICKDNLSLKRFMSCFDLYAPLLPPPDDQPAPPDSLTPEEAAAYFAEAEADVRAADRDMADIKELERKGVVHAGRLPEQDALRPRLRNVMKHHSNNRKKFADMEKRVMGLLQTYASSIDTLSEKFVELSEILAGAEIEVARLEKEKAERTKRGLT
ncbi:hypothetical protein CALVIDRAFT_309988 [Calocera viscosa TUFC12733]|uniref:Uncharacterized protein n=1 Tax=Calocera viscosa (strain TUFC12733) TaxID=1330018 RepID=A0A167I8N7_CALVF|nr:hypothetical protein CALVIDRAFT_309988 [Calocera viscosa TUFC12733]